MNYYGMPIVTNIMLTVPYEDWSKVRSPARARRRRWRHKQNIRYMQKPDQNVYQVDGKLHMHPEMLMRLRKDADALKFLDHRSIQ